jgi:lysozyme
MSDVALFDLLRRFKRRWSGTRAGLTQAEVEETNAAIGRSARPSLAPPSPSAALPSVKGGLVAIVGSLAASSLFATIPEDEGLRLTAYRDIVGVWTICNGDTKNVLPGMKETPEGCRRRLDAQLVAHAKPVMACSPRLAEPGRDWQRAAAVSLAYNIGVGAYCRSSVDRAFDAGNWRAGCDAFLKFRFAGGRAVRGLTLRRQRERALCLKGLS